MGMGMCEVSVWIRISEYLCIKIYDSKPYKWRTCYIIQCLDILGLCCWCYRQKCPGGVGEKWMTVFSASFLSCILNPLKHQRPHLFSVFVSFDTHFCLPQEVIKVATRSWASSWWEEMEQIWGRACEADDVSREGWQPFCGSSVSLTLVPSAGLGHLPYKTLSYAFLGPGDITAPLLRYKTTASYLASLSCHMAWW